MGAQYHSQAQSSQHLDQEPEGCDRQIFIFFDCIFALYAVRSGLVFANPKNASMKESLSVFTALSASFFVFTITGTGISGGKGIQLSSLRKFYAFIEAAYHSFLPAYITPLF